MKNHDKTMANYAKWVIKKKLNLLPSELKILRISELINCQSASSIKKSMGQMSVGIYRQNVITIMMLAILPSFVRKSYFHRLASKKLLYIHRVYSFMLINYYLHYPHLILLQTSTTNHQLQKSLLILEPWTISLQIMHISLPMKNIIMSSKLVPEKYL